MYQHYEKQWMSILPEQERRFALFRERKSLIGRCFLTLIKHFNNFFYFYQNVTLFVVIEPILITKALRKIWICYETCC